MNNPIHVVRHLCKIGKMNMNQKKLIMNKIDKIKNKMNNNKNNKKNIKKKRKKI